MRFAAQRVEHHVEWTCPGEVFPAVIHYALGPQLRAVVPLCRRRDHHRTELARDLDRQSADAPSSSMYEDAHAALHVRHLDERNPRRKARDAKARGRNRVDARRHRRAGRLRQDGKFRMSAITPRVGDPGN